MCLFVSDEQHCFPLLRSSTPSDRVPQPLARRHLFTLLLPRLPLPPQPKPIQHNPHRLPRSPRNLLLLPPPPIHPLLSCPRKIRIRFLIRLLLPALLNPPLKHPLRHPLTPAPTRKNPPHR